MPRTVQIDFIGMCVYVLAQDPPRTPIKVGLLHEPRHVHLISYRVGGVTVLKGIQAGNYEIEHHPAGDVEIHDTPQTRLPDLYDVSGIDALDQDKLDAAMRVTLTLPQGDLTPQAPTDPGAERDWIFRTDLLAPKPREYTTSLTDRTQFTFSTNYDRIVLYDPTRRTRIEIPLEDDTFHLSISAIDSDLGERVVKPDDGFQLCEFQLLYACTQKFGPAPIYRKNGADPDSPICPQARVRPR
jgi:hypothetical protein